MPKRRTSGESVEEEEEDEEGQDVRAGVRALVDGRHLTKRLMSRRCCGSGRTAVLPVINRVPIPTPPLHLPLHQHQRRRWAPRTCGPSTRAPTATLLHTAWPGARGRGGMLRYRSPASVACLFACQLSLLGPSCPSLNPKSCPHPP